MNEVLKCVFSSIDRCEMDISRLKKEVRRATKGANLAIVGLCVISYIEFRCIDELEKKIDKLNKKGQNNE